jgi:hypothetical protein
MADPEIQAKTFYKQVAASRVVWTIRDDAGIPVPQSDEDHRVMPFWSSRALAELIVKNVPDYHGFYPIEIAWQDFMDKWLPGLIKDGLLAGINWSGSDASGFDISPAELITNVEKAIRNAS